MFVAKGYCFLGKFAASNFEGCKNKLNIKTFTNTNKAIKNFSWSKSILKKP
jgi:hypothetical protein